MNEQQEALKQILEICAFEEIWECLAVSAIAYKALKSAKVDIPNEEDLVNLLEGDNNWEENFLEE